MNHFMLRSLPAANLRKPTKDMSLFQTIALGELAFFEMPRRTRALGSARIVGHH